MLGDRRDRLPSRHRFRIAVLVVVVSCALFVGWGLLGAGQDSGRLDGAAVGTAAAAAPPSDGITVVATDSNNWGDGPDEPPRGTAELLALRANGTVLYANGTHDKYWDVDPVRRGGTTVEYAFSDHLEGEACPTDLDHEAFRVDEDTWARYDRRGERCTRNGVERVDLRTGNVTRVWSQITPGGKNTRYHDADRLDEEHLVVADIYLDRVFVVNTTTERIEWRWNASDAFPTDSGGPYPSDWTHINDVEVLPDGRIMVSVRNHDQVVFLDRSGLIEEWTLGTDGDHETLYEQHNPDYIPATAGGPAVLVGDSENNRVVEYQRSDGEWTRSWTWRDARVQWPRDADRLPNGHTLITDSNGDRVFEVDEAGSVVWSVEVAFPYEAERLGTGAESTGGPSAQARGLESRERSVPERFWLGVKSVFPSKYLNGLLYLTPVWMGFREVVALLVALSVGLVWTGLELRWFIADRRS